MGEEFLLLTEKYKDKFCKWRRGFIDALKDHSKFFASDYTSEILHWVEISYIVFLWLPNDALILEHFLFYISE